VAAADVLNRGAIDELLLQEFAMKTVKLVLISFLLGASGIACAEGPVNYPADTPEVTTKTRDQVNEELAAARRAGKIFYGVRDAAKDRDETPSAAAKTRTQVMAELAEARRLGLVVYGEADVPVATPEQERKIAEAGRRALAHEVASK
jgi:hypothetical protein